MNDTIDCSGRGGNRKIRVSVHGTPGGRTYFDSPTKAAEFLVRRYGRDAINVEIGGPRSLFEATWQEVDRLLANAPSIAEEALTQIQQIAYDGQLGTDAERIHAGKGTEAERAMYAKLGRINNIAESAAPDDNWQPLTEDGTGGLSGGGDRLVDMTRPLTFSPIEKGMR